MANVLTVKVNGGILKAEPSQDPDYPGMDIEFIPDNGNHDGTYPRVLLETPRDGEGFDPLRCLVWADKDSEDYTNEICFNYFE